jgi:hypothetical protein
MWKRPPVALALVAFAALLAIGAPSSRAVAEPSSAGVCSSGSRAALVDLSCELTRALGPASPGLLVVAGPLVSELEPREPARLAGRIANLVAAATGAGARADVEVRDLSAARRAAGRGALLYLGVRLTRDRLEVTADRYAPAPRFWARVKNPTPGVTAHAFASRPLDAELRSYLPPVPLVARARERIAGADSDLTALACGDTDGDGSNELFLVGRRRITVGRVREKKLVVERSVSWSDLGPVAPSPLREPLASVRLERPGSVSVGLSDRAEAVELDASLAKRKSLGRKLPWPAGGCAELVDELLVGRSVPCGGTTGPSFDGSLDAISSATLSLPNGEQRVVSAARNAADGSVSVQDGAGKLLRLERAGAQLALGDLDGDGAFELVSTLDTLNPTEDAVVVWSAGTDGKLREKFRVAMPAGVRALGICPLEGAGIAPIAVATGEGLWLLR